MNHLHSIFNGAIDACFLLMLKAIKINDITSYFSTNVPGGKAPTIWPKIAWKNVRCNNTGQLLIL